MPSTSKLIAIALTGTGVVGAGAATYYTLKSNTPEVSTKSKISKLITNSGRTLLDNDATNLEIKFYVYGKLENKPNLTENNKEALKQWCQGVINEEIEISKKDEENSNFKTALKLCTKPTNKEKLEKNNKKIAEKDDWTEIQGKYSLVTNKNKIPTLIGKEGVTVEDISNWCSKTLDKEVVEDEHKLTDAWCTKQAG